MPHKFISELQVVAGIFDPQALLQNYCSFLSRFVSTQVVYSRFTSFPCLTIMGCAGSNDVCTSEEDLCVHPAEEAVMQRKGNRSLR